MIIAAANKRETIQRVGQTLQQMLRQSARFASGPRVYDVCGMLRH